MRTITVHYYTDTPGKIACIGDTFETDGEFSSFITSVNEPVTVNTHKIIWSGDNPGEGSPYVVKIAQTEIDAALLFEAKKAALITKLEEIDIEKTKRIVDGAVFLHTDGHYYHIDDRSFLAFSFMLPGLPETYQRSWKTADLNSNGIDNVYVDMTRDELLALIREGFKHYSNMWDICDAHKKAAKNIAKDDTKTPEDITNYDHTAGWQV